MMDIVNDTCVIHINQIPSYKIRHASERKILKRVLMVTYAGLGDQVCAEPTLRYAMKCKEKGEIDYIGLASPASTFYQHLKFDEIIGAGATYDQNEWMIFNTIPTLQGLAYEHISHGLTNCVDASSLYAFRMQLANKDKEIFITGNSPSDEEIFNLFYQKSTIVVHPGKHWPSKTFPKVWWDNVLLEIRKKGIKPILIGSNMDGNRTTVSVDSTGCVDLRGKTDIGELAWICQRASVVLTNDSSPLHLAASTDPRDVERTGRAAIHFLATCKHADYITHWRKGEFAWNEFNHSKGGVWDHLGFLPNKEQDVRVDNFGNQFMKEWLPDPKEFAAHALHSYYKEDTL